MKSIKESIEILFKKINDSRDKLLNEITSSFIEQRIKLDELEKKLKNELDIKITELKERLEKYYIKSNDTISSCERIFKAIQYYEKNYNNNNIKTLCYIICSFYWYLKFYSKKYNLLILIFYNIYNI